MSSHAQVVPGYYITPPQDEFNNSFDAPESSQEALYPSSPYTGFEPVQSLESVQSLFIPSIPMTLSVEGYLMTPSTSSQGQPQLSQDSQTVHTSGQGGSGRAARKEGEVCPYCPKQLKNLKRHIESVHPEKLLNRPKRHACYVLECKRYGQKDFRLDNLRCHQRQVHGIHIPKKQRGRARVSSTNTNVGLESYTD
ncbi:hypothetical protein FPQ18DRAFT_101657 [Pyronema domesticum]|nr:hypothetical protein FPQ18DRAFT_101657 [Pyronema domesticum]